MRVGMRTSLLVGGLLGALVLLPATARAQAQDFGNKGQLAILNDSNLQLTGTSESNNGGSSFTFSVLPSVEYFVIDNLSLGGFVEYAHTSISPGGNGPSTNTDTFGVGPRVLPRAGAASRHADRELCQPRRGSAPGDRLWHRVRAGRWVGL